MALSENTVVAGAVFDDVTGLANAGSACVFIRSGASWYQQAKLTAADAAGADAFGRSVAIAGDLAVVGSNQDDRGGMADAGSMYVFRRSDGDWVQQSVVGASNAAASDFLGSSVAISRGRAVAGAMFHDQPLMNDAGAAYVYCLNCFVGDCDCDADVDDADLDLLLACATGPGVTYNTAPSSQCGLAPDASGHIAPDLDRDADVDSVDFGVLQRCWSGTGLTADPNCGL